MQSDSKESGAFVGNPTYRSALLTIYSLLRVLASLVKYTVLVLQHAVSSVHPCWGCFIPQEAKDNREKHNTCIILRVRLRTYNLPTFGKYGGPFNMTKTLMTDWFLKLINRFQGSTSIWIKNMIKPYFATILALSGKAHWTATLYIAL